MSLQETENRFALDVAKGAVVESPELRSRHPLLVVAILVCLLILCAMVLPIFGPTHMDLQLVLRLKGDAATQDIERHIFFSARLPRILFGMLVGASLALAGTAYQAILRNDLAEPFTLGVSGGAAVGALLAFNLAGGFLGAILVPISAITTGGLAVALIYTLARMRGPLTSPATLLLAGVTMNFLFIAASLLIQYLSAPYETLTIVRWMMGGLDISSYRVILVGLAILAASFVILYTMGKSLNLLSLGDRTAHHLGVSVEKTRLITLAVSSILAAFMVAFAGPIGFVGLVVPHVMRLIVGADHRVLIPVTTLAGGVFLGVCDTIARSALGTTEVPVGIITAFLGAPFFLWLLFRKSGG